MRVEKNKAFAYRIYSHFTQQCNAGLCDKDFASKLPYPPLPANVFAQLTLNYLGNL